MPISATGNQRASRILSLRPTPSARGFTLLELMLVMAVMAVVAGLVLPNLFQPARGSLDDSARRMVRLLHLAAEEAQLRGTSLRFNAWADHYNFELAGESGQWALLTEPPFTRRDLPDDVRVSEVKLAEGVAFYGSLSGRSDKPDSPASSQADSQAGDKAAGEQPPLGSVVLMSDGMLTLADVNLHSSSGDVHIELRPGPGGIHLTEPGS